MGQRNIPSGHDATFGLGIAHLLAAQQWQCPCSSGDAHSRSRVSCLHESRVNVVELYAHRQGSDSFKVGQRTDFCAAAYALSCGVNFETFKRARADVTLDRPPWCERKRQRTARVEASAAQVRGYKIINALTRS